MSKVFINYRTGDESFAAVHLDDRLCERLGAENVFRDSRAIPPGKDFDRRIWDELSGCSLMIVVMGPRWLSERLHSEADYVRREIAFALAHGIDVMPVLVGDVALPMDEDLPEDIRPLRRRQYRRIHARSAQADVDGVLTAVEGVLGAPAPAPSAPPAAGRSAHFHDLHGDLVMGDKVSGDKIVWRP
ncbi:toll/interleukin-1 receptor domain-containing protein [Actinoplanes sp. CA-142083]|uniref:toll/interleukin-1 receptor domain-containing protein n=1 Tax=Actinoplanes sp. CA-142083 TaxID=3239903 RepID=UPI003D8C780F